MKDKVAIITYDMIPNASSWGGCQRMYYLSKELSINQYDVTVFSVKKNTNNDYGNKINFNIIQYSVKNKLLKNFIDSKNIVNTKANEKNLNGLNLIKKARRLIKDNKLLLNILSKLDNYIFNEPTFLSGLISRVWVNEYQADIILYLKVHHFKKIIISVPSFGLLRIASFIKKEIPDSVIIFDYRDPWNLWHQNSRKSLRQEINFLNSADQVVCTTDNLKQDFASKLGVDIKKIKVISNGYSSQDWKEIQLAKTNNEKLIISYVGSIEIIHSGIRNVEKLMIAFKSFTDIHKNVLLRFIGVNDCNNTLIRQYEALFGDKVEFHPVVSSYEAKKYMLESDALLLLHTTEDASGKYIISGKFYDYVRAGKIIFSISAIDSNHWKIIKSENLGLNSINDEKEIYDSLESLYTLWKNGNTKLTNTDIYRFSREFQNQNYLKLLNSIEINKKVVQT
ncbi:hypothetical protein MKA58_17695 [[Clostridium] innocuum]|nr:hypothetical protein [[Clostridium] innocuum]